MTREESHPRELTPRIRAELGLSEVMHPPYRWAFAAIVVTTACVPLLLASLYKTCLLVVAVAFVILPLVRWLERRDATRRDDVYRFGTETTARVLDVEPSGPDRSDHIVRVEFRARGAVVHASVIGCPLARRGLMPEDEVVVIYAPERPTRCLVVRKVAREIVDAIFED